MTAWRMVDHDELRSLFVAIRDISWSWRADDVEGLCLRMGWRLLLEDFDERGGFADAGWDRGGDDVELAFRDGQVDDITMWITQNVREAGPDREQFLGDAFADAVKVAAEVLGTPTARDLSDPPNVRWRLADSTVLVRRSSTTVVIGWASNRFQDHWDAVTEALA